MKINKILKIGITILFVLILAYCLNYGLKYANIGSAYNAKMVCSCTFLQNRSLENIKAEELYAVPFSTIEVNKIEQSVSVDIYGIAKTKAIYRKGLGCTLVNEMKESELRKQPKLKFNYLPPFEFEANIVNNIAVETAINEAFIETDLKDIKRTRAIVILQNGKIIAEKYAKNITPETPLIGWSMTKSVTNAMIGILVKEGKLDLKKPAPLAEWEKDERKNITIDHLLRMSSGLDWEENYAQPSTATEMLFRTKNSGNFALNVPSKYKPNEQWYYSSGTTNILQEIIKRQFPKLIDYQRFPHEKLFQKIGMRSAVLEPDASGTYVGSSFMFATARDWAKFGQLYLQDGIWEGERILPEGWVKYSSTETPNSKGEYAAHFWLYHNDNLYPKEVYHAIGFEGQYITIVPSQNLVIVRLGCTPGDNFDHSKLVREISKATK